MLHAPYDYDDSLIRNALGYELSNRIGRYAPRTRFFELFLVGWGETLTLGDYMGVYVLIELRAVERGVERGLVPRGAGPPTGDADLDALLPRSAWRLGVEGSPRDTPIAMMMLVSPPGGAARPGPFFWGGHGLGLG